MKFIKIQDIISNIKQTFFNLINYIRLNETYNKN